MGVEAMQARRSRVSVRRARDPAGVSPGKGGATQRVVVLSAIASALLGGILAGGCTPPYVARAVLVATPTEGLAPLLVEFRVQESTHDRNGLASFVLDFGDGTPSVQSNDFAMPIPHVYDPAGTYVARLKVTADGGQADEVTAEITATLDELPHGATIGSRAYEFTAPTTDGRDVTLSDLRGSVVLMEFWGSWCIPCRTSMPHINALWEAYHEQGLVVLAVSTDPRAEDATEYLEANGFTGLTCIWEPGGKYTRIKVLYEVDWIPRSIVVDRTGIVRYNGHPMDLTAEFVEAVLAGDSRAPELQSVLWGQVGPDESPRKLSTPDAWTHSGG